LEAPFHLPRPIDIKTWPVEQSSHLRFFKTTASDPTSPVGNTFTGENALSSFIAGERKSLTMQGIAPAGWQV
jgi:hypothetical protein